MEKVFTSFTGERAKRKFRKLDENCNLSALLNFASLYGKTNFKSGLRCQSPVYFTNFVCVRSIKQNGLGMMIIRTESYFWIF